MNIHIRLGQSRAAIDETSSVSFYLIFNNYTYIYIFLNYYIDHAVLDG